MSASIKLTGLAELKRNLDILDKKAANVVMRKAARAGATPIRKAMKQKAPKATGDLRRSIRTVARKRKFGYVAITGPSNDYRGKAVPGRTDGRVNIPKFYMHLVELGFTAPDGRPVPAQPFARPAFDEQQDNAIARAKQKMAEEITVEANKLRVTKR